MKNIILIIISITLCTESFASGCMTGYACSLKDLQKTENIKNETARKITQQRFKSNTLNKSFEKKSKRPDRYDELFKFKEILY